MTHVKRSASLFKRSVSVAVLLLATSVVPSMGFAKLAPPPPVAQRGDTVDHLYGKDIADPYRWMEGQDNAAYTTWLKAQGAAGRTWLDSWSGLDGWRTRLDAASAGSVTNRGQHRVAGRLFFQRLEQGKQGVLMERLADGSEKVLFDPNAAQTDGGHVSITNYTVSRRTDGRSPSISTMAAMRSPVSNSTTPTVAPSCPTNWTMSGANLPPTGRSTARRSPIPR